MFNEAKYLNETKKYNEFTYWFRRCRGNVDAFEVIRIDTKEVIGVYNYFLGTFRNPCTGDEITDMLLQANVDTEFGWYKERPEYQVGRRVVMEKMNPELAVTVYETLLVGIQFIRAEKAGVDPDSAYPQISNTLNWLRQTDIYTAPGSTRYHDNYSGGLIIHHLNVYNSALDLMIVKRFSEAVELDSIALLALTHDWCKIGFYESYMRNVKNDETGQWEKKQEWKYRDEPLGVSLGHGVSSMYLVGRCFRLTQEEATALRWHMGWCRVVNDEMNELQACNERYPLVHLLQFADQLSIVKY